MFRYRIVGYGMNDFPILDTVRLRLREIVAADAPEVFATHGDVQAMRWFGTDPMTTVQQAEKLIETFAAGRQMPNPGTRWGMERKADHRLIGSCGLFKWNRTWGSCVIGYELASSAQGEGFMFEALSAILDWGFENMQLDRIEAQVHPENVASIKLLQKLGFVQEGRLREAGFWLGRRHDLLAFGLLRREYSAPRFLCRSMTELA
jgi:[ribosomal protein S5]-alanine N-acetyltransferase